MLEVSEKLKMDNIMDINEILTMQQISFYCY